MKAVTEKEMVPHPPTPLVSLPPRDKTLKDTSFSMRTRKIQREPFVSEHYTC